jgi:hypothetical protein
LENRFFSDGKIELDDDFSGNYIFSSIDMVEIDEFEHIDLSPYENLDENIYIKIVKLDSDKYKIETNFWLLNEQMNLETIFNGFLYHIIRNRPMPPLIHEEPALFTKTDLQIRCHENSIVVDYSHENSRLERVHIIETTDTIIKRDGSIFTATTTTRQPDYSPYKVVIKCRIFFKRINNAEMRKTAHNKAVEKPIFSSLAGRATVGSWNVMRNTALNFLYKIYIKTC